MDTERRAGCSSDDAGDENVSESAMRSRITRCSSLTDRFTLHRIKRFYFNAVSGSKDQ